MRDAGLEEHISAVFEANYRVYGARKIRRELNRQGHTVARCTVERLMRELGITGAVRGRRVITSLPGGQTTGPRTSSTATSSPAPRTGAGSRTSPT
ncbi:IS3 family transposase [Streptomyces tendae]|uniref:IS3 family transposase n=1 Tax=Streptomyces tendae TaxID=1932 RepID=UPI003423213C